METTNVNKENGYHVWLVEYFATDIELHKIYYGGTVNQFNEWLDVFRNANMIILEIKLIIINN